MSLEHRFAREDAAARKRSRPTTKADETPEFVLFWDAWRPRMNANDGRGSARDEFFRHVEVGADPMDMVDGARWFMRSGGNTGTDQHGRPVRLHAQTWLNRRAYEDGAEQERAHQRRQAEKAAQGNNVMPLRRVELPDNHFSKRWERERKQGEGA